MLSNTDREIKDPADRDTFEQMSTSTRRHPFESHCFRGDKPTVEEINQAVADEILLWPKVIKSMERSARRKQWLEAQQNQSKNDKRSSLAPFATYLAKKTDPI